MLTEFDHTGMALLGSGAMEIVVSLVVAYIAGVYTGQAVKQLITTWL